MWRRIGFGPKSVRVRVWDGATDPSADQTVTIPTPAPVRVYLPHL